MKKILKYSFLRIRSKLKAIIIFAMALITTHLIMKFSKSLCEYNIKFLLWYC